MLIKQLSLAFLLISSFGLAAAAADNEKFAFGIAGVRPVLWKNFEPIFQNSMKCFKDGKDETPVCKKVSDEVVARAYDALVHAWMINAFDKEKGPYFCTDYPSEIIKKGEVHKGAAYALLLLDNRLKYGSGLYGNQLSETYLAKIVFDALVDEHPCEKKQK